MTSACLVGSTGLVGSHLLTLLASQSAISSVYAYTRRDIPESPKTHAIRETDSTKWPSRYPNATEVFFSALGTTARIAGSLAKQREIDYDLNVALAKAAKDSGTKVYVLISTSGASPTSMIPYSKMKGELDEAVKTLGFEHTIILKPGLLVGTREDSRPGEFAGRKMADFMGWISGNRLKDVWAQDADVVAKAAIAAAMEAVDGKNSEKIRVLGMSDIIRLGREKWQGNA